MREIIKEYIDGSITRRSFIQALVAAGLSLNGSKSLAQAISTTPITKAKTKNFTGTGGELIVETVSAAGVEYIFGANGTGLYPFYDALVERKKPRFILSTEEGQAVSMAEGYHLATGKTGFVNMARIGLPHASNNLYNAWKDQSSIVVITDGPDTRYAGRNGFEDVDDWLETVEQFTKWRWMAKWPERIPELVKRAFQLSMIPPGGPTYLMVPTDVMKRDKISAEIPFHDYYEFSLNIEPDSDEIERAAKMIIESKAPLIHVGHEVTRAGAVKDLVELAELLNIPVTQGASVYKDFPTAHNLFHGKYFAGFTYDYSIDLFINFGTQMPDMSMMALGIPGPLPEGAKIIHARMDTSDIARIKPVDVGIAGNVKKIIRAIIDAVKSQLPNERIEKIKKSRESKILAFKKRLIKMKEDRIKKRWNNSPLSWERFTSELKDYLDDDAIIVPEVENPRGSTDLIDFSPDGRKCIGWTMGSALGWGHGAAVGVKIAEPDRQVVSLIGDGGFMFCGCSALWSSARYEVPLLTVIYNNRSYDGPRSRMFSMGRKQGQMGKDIACYLGNPDVEYSDYAKSFGVEGEKIESADQIKPALERAKSAIKRGEPYLLDVIIERLGPGSKSTWYPKTSIKEMRSKPV
ncbi:MAG: thiamine pyrophosphate-binding protein [Candidatus Schekmanbacteria bacterium]|nr:MAG: thiamine pyrophosphate-binding protein [Candidatus Schekmanbacteria bacterium]